MRVSTGSLPVLSAEGLADLWVGQARAIRSNASRQCKYNQRGADKAEAQARQLEACAEELRRWVALPNQRQPEENTAIRHAAPDPSQLKP